MNWATERAREVVNSVGFREDPEAAIAAALREIVGECVAAVEDADLDASLLVDCDVRVHLANTVRAALPTIKTGDTVRHRPSGEKWLVAYAENGRVCPCGWPETLANESDCELVKSASLDERLNLLREIADLSGADSRRSYARRALGLTTALILCVISAGAGTLSSSPATTCQLNGSACTTIAITPHERWAPALGGSQWISIAQTGWPLATWLPNGTAVSFSEVFSLDSMPSAAMVTWAADDSASLWLNGALVAAEASTAGNMYSTCSDFAPTCRYHTSVDVLPWLLVGSNEIRFDVAQRGGWSFGLNYAVGLTWLDEPPLHAPEPGTWISGIALAIIVALGVIDSRWEARKIRALDARVDRLTETTVRYRETLFHIASCSRDEDIKAVARKALEE